MPRGLTILLFIFSASLLVAQDSPAPEKKGGAPGKSEDCPTDDPKEPKIDPDLEVVTPTTAPFGDPHIQNAIKRIHERQSQPESLKAAITVKRSNPILKKPTTTTTGTLWCKRTANGRRRILWEEIGSRTIVMNDASTYVKWEGSKDAFEFPHRKREKYFALFPFFSGVSTSFLGQFDFDFFAVPSEKSVAELPESGDAPAPPAPEKNPGQEPAKPTVPRDIHEVTPPPGVVDAPVVATPEPGKAETDFPTSKDEYIFRLIPKIDAKPGEAPYAASLNNTTVWININTLAVTRIVLIETNGERTEIAIDKVEAVADIPEITFTRPLDGVRIIEAK